MAFRLRPVFLCKNVYIYPRGVYNDMQKGINDMDIKTCPACTGKSKHREETEYKDLVKRLNRIEGQVRGIRNMVEEDKYCVDIMVQASAVESAIRAFNTALLKRHIQSCVVEDIKKGNEEAVDELCELLPRMIK